MALIAAVFAASRVYAQTCGLRFDAHTWRAFWHFIDPALLATQLGQSLWYLHGQPPLFSAWLGLYGKVFGSAAGEAFRVTFLVVGMLIARETYVLALRAGLGVWPAAWLSSVIIASPASLLFENFLFYTYPEAWLLLLCTNLALSVVERPSTLRSLGLAFALCGLVLMRSLFHPAWGLAVLGIVLHFVGRKHLRSLALGAVVPLMLVCVVAVKNAVLYDTTSLSTWRGMNLARVVVDRMPEPLRADWVRRGILSPLAAVGSFRRLADYGSSIRLRPPTGIALLDQASKSNGAVNLHHVAYVEISRTLERDAVTVMRHRPEIYVRSVVTNLTTTFEPSWHYRALKASAKRLRGYGRAWQAVVGLSPPQARGPSIGWLFITPLVLIWAGMWLWARRQRPDAHYAAVTFCVIQVLYVIGVGALLERSENQRFRFDVDPFIGVLVLLALRNVHTFVRSRLGGG